MQRLLTALVLAPAVLWIVLAGPYNLFFGLVAGVAAICYYEFGGIAEVGVKERWLGVTIGTAMLFLRPDQWFLPLAMFPLLTLALALRFETLAHVLPVTAAQSMGLLYIYGTWNTAFLIRAISPYWLAFALGVNWLGDTGAYYLGRQFGRHKLAALVSPGKTWEGAAGSVLVSVIFGAWFLPHFLPAVPVWLAIVISATANVVGQFGDLAESAIKRGAGVKDSGSLLPGHGGLLDRVDSSLFSLPVVYGFLYFTSI
ncbi:MAG: phosphatidate cytidylyltransferase [Acidobacteriota bacterium]|nr:phosphatidate cytidylyltransferase [Acidobacteriota bacterium]